jgi:hypothetical protein
MNSLILYTEQMLYWNFDIIKSDTSSGSELVRLTQNTMGVAKGFLTARQKSCLLGRSSCWRVRCLDRRRLDALTSLN